MVRRAQEELAAEVDWRRNLAPGPSMVSRIAAAPRGLVTVVSVSALGPFGHAAPCQYVKKASVRSQEGSLCHCEKRGTAS